MAPSNKNLKLCENLTDKIKEMVFMAECKGYIKVYQIKTLVKLLFCYLLLLRYFVLFDLMVPTFTGLAKLPDQINRTKTFRKAEAATRDVL